LGMILDDLGVWLNWQKEKEKKRKKERKRERGRETISGITSFFET
jgi:hypothetical protein